MRGHRYIFITALLAIVILCAQDVYASGGATPTTQDSTHKRFPYDTTVSLCNNAFSQGIKANGMDVGMQYLGLTKNGRIGIVDSGKGAIIIENVITNDSDKVWFGSIEDHWIFPDTLQPGDTLWLTFTFAPTNGGGGGARHYQVRYAIVNSTGDTVYATAGGTGVQVDMYTHIDTTYVCYLDSTVTVSLMVDSIIDPMRNDNVHGYIMEMSHYNRAVVTLNKSYNVEITKSSGIDLPGEGEGTLSEGATVVDAIQDDNRPDHTVPGGSQAYYELIVNNTINQIENPGILIKYKFMGIALDTSRLMYNIPGVYDNQGNQIFYVNVHSSPGLITVIPPPKFGYSVYPNPFDQSAAIHFSISNPTHARLTVYNSLGQSVGTIFDQNLSPGDFTTNFNANGLPNGIYFYTLTTTNSGTYHGRMELLR